MKEYDRGWADAYDQVKEDLELDNAAEDGPPPTEPTPEMWAEAEAEVDAQVEEHLKELHGEADVE